jgi:ATP-dependent Clp protease adapter protein ClpS
MTAQALLLRRYCLGNMAPALSDSRPAPSSPSAAPGLPRASCLPHTLSLRHTLQEPPPRPTAPPGERPDPAAGERLAVRVLDNPVNTYQQVMDVCSEALGISSEAAFGIARAIDTAGSCVVCVAPRLQAERVAARIRTIGIEVRLERVDESAAGS